MKKLCLSRVSIQRVSGLPPYITRRNCVFAWSRRRLDDLRACSRFITLFFGVSSNRAATEVKIPLGELKPVN
jgi:hypothetical protein